jgi:OFA family oxalate/formate antiporter-like MFS transporter
MDEKQAKRTAILVVIAAWLAVFCLFGFRATFAILKVPMSEEMGWSAGDISLGYAFMMSIYAITAFFSGMIVDKWDTKPAYFLAAIFGALGFYVTSFTNSLFGYYAAYGILAGVGTGMLWVSSTVSVRKWYIGKDYAKMWGFAFMGAPVAQFVLAYVTKGVIATSGWRAAWQVLGGVVLVAMLLATFIARKSPDAYGAKPFGALPDSMKEEYVWGVGESFSRYAMWGVILAFLTSMVAESLIWTQTVSYWAQDLKMGLGTTTTLYSIIGVVGIFSMPIMGIVADKVVQSMRHEAKGRKAMLILGPAVGALACIMVLLTAKSIVWGGIACFLFAIYWAIEPGGVVGYTGAVYGRKTLGKIWGLATLICMGIGPAVGTYLGGYFRDVTGRYTTSIAFALGAFVVSALFAIALPLAAYPKHEREQERERVMATAGR